MAKNIIVSNRLPVQAENKEGEWIFSPTSGGLATGLKSFHNEGKSLWIGWPGVSSDSLNKKSKRQINEDLLDKQFCPVFLNELELDNFYFGFSNKCLWPLFHYFIELAKFNENDWLTYVDVNKKFCEKVIQNTKQNGVVSVSYTHLTLPTKRIV